MIGTPRFSESVLSKIAGRREALRRAHLKVSVAQAAIDAAAAKLNRSGGGADVRTGSDDAAQATEDRLAWELATAKAALAEAQIRLRKAAADVLAAILEREAENLHALEIEAARRRAELFAAVRRGDRTGAGPRKIPPVAGTVLEYPIQYLDAPEIRFGAAERSSPWRTIYTALIIGNPDADLDSETEENGDGDADRSAD